MDKDKDQNELTKRLIAEGWTKEKHPDWVNDYDWFYGGFRYTSKHLDSLVFATACGLLIEGSHWGNGTSSYMGIDWIPENNNPTVKCPRGKVGCELNHEIFKNNPFGGGRAKMVYCVCHLTGDEFSYDRSLKKVTDIEFERRDALFREYQKKYRVCQFQSGFNEWKDRWSHHYDPIDYCPKYGCSYCTVLKKELSKKRGNVFYDLKITRPGIYRGFLTKEHEITITKGKKALSKPVSMDICEIIAKTQKRKILDKEEMRLHAEIFLEPRIKVEILNIRAERRESKDILQDLQDVREGFIVSHESDLNAAAKEKKSERREEAKEKKKKKLSEKIIKNGLEQLSELDFCRARKVLSKEEFRELEAEHQKSLEVKPEKFEQLSLF
ncbi:hypothetical protein LNN31_13705 [Acetobacterium wieringae]|uniref:Uncharacterized protein n=1 Tax=Acetobacterium wieringae TaxID=52694 RepID=A0ABY6HBV9_9FIRM|nr:hypothetical protein [Acetobacterium wieringae]UYO61830.1 hypothetical protein LNN31_13705 [Acetobacterium wieringae]